MLVIKNAKIYTMAEDGIIENGAIFIKDGKIKDLGEEIEAPEGVEIIDAGGKMLLPGLIDAHCHLGLSEDAIGFEGADYNESVDPLTPQLRAIDSINPMDRTLEEAYQGGVTVANTGPGSANVIGGTFVAIKTYGKRVDDMVLKNPTGMKCAFGENPKRVYNAQDKSPITRMATASLLRESLIKAKDYQARIELADGDIGKTPPYDEKLEALIPVINREIPLKSHAHRADDIFTAIRIARELEIDITLEHCTEGHLIADYLAEEGYPAIVGPSFGDRPKFELKNTTFETPGILQRAGVKVAITTDSPVVPLHHLTMSAGYCVKAGMEQLEALKAITINPAEIIGIADRVGSLEIGKDADLVIFDSNPLTDLLAEVEYTIIDGEIVYKRKKWRD